MARKKSYLTVTDQFCGAGGSSQGVRRLAERSGGGLEVRLALNHWKLAIETHNTNFPDTMHDCTDISAADPRRYPSTDILITSPECTTHSPAGGNNHKTLRKQMDMFDSGAIDPATERSRATMWDVCRFAEYHKYRCIIVENVVEAKTRWALFDVWLTAMHTLGYNHRLVFHNSMHHHPTPQSRDRMYIVFWQKGQRAPLLEHTPAANCSKCCKDVKAVQTWKDKRKNWGKYKKQYVYCCPGCSTIVEPYYYAGFNCIDWTIPGRRIGDIKLSPNTIRRARIGKEKFWNNPIHPIPYIIKGENLKSKDDSYVTSSLDVLRTQTTWQTMGVVSPLPFLIEHNSNGSALSISEPISTVTCGGMKNALVLPPCIIENKGKSIARPGTRPLPAQTTKTTSGILTAESFQYYVSYYNGGSDVNTHITQPINTFPTRHRAALVSCNAPELEDCYYRTLRATEVKIGMAFDKNYIVLGDVKDQVRQLGNAVTPPAMEWLVDQCVASLQ